MKYVTLNRLLIAAGILALGLGGFFLIWFHREITIGRTEFSDQPQTLSSLTGKPCINASLRPIAVMLASDPVARPLSGIGQADVVIEMPVTPRPNEVTRIMGIFHCNEPQEIGSIRSARGPFIPLAAGLGALYAHWGGEQGSLERLNAGVLDNIDALKYDGTTFYRKESVKAPHNGFTTLQLLREKARDLGYAMLNTFSGYSHKNISTPRNSSQVVDIVTLDYEKPYNVRWEYDREQKNYKRFRNDTPEIDKLTSEQVRTQNIVVMQTTAEPFRTEYLEVETTGQGQATLYQAGTKFNIFWKKDSASLGSKLQFVDSIGKEVPFVPGTIWIEIKLTP